MLDEDNFLFIGKNNKIELTIPETRIMQMLIENKNGITRTTAICKAIYCGYVDSGLILATQVRISRLKRKLPTEIDIVNRNGIGYKILYKE